MLFSKKSFASFLGVCLFLGSAVSAQVSKEQPFYLQFKVFDQSLDANAPRFTSLIQGVLGAGESIGSYRLDEPGAGFKLTDGVVFNRYLGLEGGLGYMGESDHLVSTLSGRDIVLSSETYSLDMALVVRYPLYRTLAAFGRVGAAYWRSEYDFKEGGALLGEDHDAGVEATLGLGLRLTLADRILLELAYDQVEYDSMDLSSITVGLGFRY